MRAKAKGTRAERLLQEQLEERGYVTVRVAGSGSRDTAFCDLVTWHPRYSAVFIEVKSRALGSSVSIPNNMIVTSEIVSDYASDAVLWVLAIKVPGSSSFRFYDQEMLEGDGHPKWIKVNGRNLSRMKTIEDFFPVQCI